MEQPKVRLRATQVDTVVPPEVLQCAICKSWFKSIRALSGHLKVHGLIANDYYNQHVQPKNCPQCGTIRLPGSNWRGRFWNRNFCSLACSNKAKFRGSRRNFNGYIVLTISGLPLADRKLARQMATYMNGRGVLEHRLVMAKKLGRALLPHETVHHLDGSRDNNDINNLELWAKKHTPGARGSDLTCPHCGKGYADERIA